MGTARLTDLLVLPGHLSKGEHPLVLDSRKQRSNFAGVDTLSVGYTLR